MTGSIEVVYRGIFQKHLGQRITRGIVLAARKEGKVGVSFGRYGDSPERNGIPAKSFAVVADTEDELQAHLARYEPKDNDVTVAVDDTLCKGVESWAWYGLQPIHKLTRLGGAVLVTSMQLPDDLLRDCHRKGAPWNLAVLRGIASFSGLWVFKDDHTDVRGFWEPLHAWPPTSFGSNRWRPPYWTSGKMRSRSAPPGKVTTGSRSGPSDRKRGTRSSRTSSSCPVGRT